MGANQKEVSEHDRFNTNRTDLCPALRWKGQFILADDDPTVPHSNEVCFGACTPRPALVPMENWPSLAIAVRLDASATKPKLRTGFRFDGRKWQPCSLSASILWFVRGEAVLRLLVLLLCSLLIIQVCVAQTATSSPTDRTITVPTNQPWTDTGIDLKPGDVVNVSATNAGESDVCNPAGQGDASSNLPVPTSPPGALVAKLSAQDTSPVVVGAVKLIPVNQPGHLFLGVNATGDPPCKGVFNVKLRIGGVTDASNMKSKLANAAQIWMSGQFGNPAAQPASTTQPGSTASMSDAGTADSGAAPALGTPLTPVKALTVLPDPVDQKLADGINTLPRRVNDEFKNLGDMTNFVIVGSEDQVKKAFDAAKWHIADSDTKQSIAKAVLLTMQKQDYMTMPMSQLVSVRPRAGFRL